MRQVDKKYRIGILGCGAIGSRIAKSTFKELKGLCRLTAIHDNDAKRAMILASSLSSPKLIKNSFEDLLKNCDLLVEAINAANARDFVKRALVAKKHVLAMSIGKLLNSQSLFSLASKNRCLLLIPSGAIAGIDAIKAASLANIRQITLTTRKPVAGFSNTPFLQKCGIDLANITEETVIFEGDVDKAVKLFPQNINVAATLALASRAKNKITIRMMTSPAYRVNSHEVEVVGDFGRMVSRTENIVCPDNPKTSYLAVLSAIQTLKDFCLGVRIGT